MISRLLRLAFPALLVACAALPSLAGDAPVPGAEPPKADAPKAAAPADPNAYPLDYCATCGPEDKEVLITKTHKGREIKMCKGCVKIFNADPDGYVKKVDKVIKEAKQVPAADVDGAATPAAK
ncbi:MAG: hypothetical protein H0V44_18695 [Planctomycetes bacterium]|nr:hypothetical protein [Planctomycetota bacterium]